MFSRRCSVVLRGVQSSSGEVKSSVGCSVEEMCSQEFEECSVVDVWSSSMVISRLLSAFQLEMCDPRSLILPNNVQWEVSSRPW
jgi:hypothetical protein